MREISRGHLRLVVSNDWVAESVVSSGGEGDVSIREFIIAAFKDERAQPYGLEEDGEVELCELLVSLAAIVDFSGPEGVGSCKDLLVGALGRLGKQYPKLFDEVVLSKFLLDVNDILVDCGPEVAPEDLKWVHEVVLGK